MGSNERLRAGLARSGLTSDAVAERTGVDPKTVQRWLGGRVPHPRNRFLVAQLLEEDDEFLWPGSRRPDPTASAATEIVAAYAYRSELDIKRWWEFFVRAESQIDLLGFTLYFLPQQHPGLVELLRNKVEAGCRLRVSLADPLSPHVEWRDEEERQAITLKVRIQSALDAFKPLAATGAEFRRQEAPLYSSIFRFDDEMLVTPHLYATPGHSAPLLHLRRLMPNGLFSRFASHFESVWSNAKPIGEDRATPD
jgi:transcriptional regulator with XRE-family HTH domain